MKKIPQVKQLGSNDQNTAIGALEKALMKIDSRVVGILRDDKKKVNTLTDEECQAIQELLAEAYWILEG